MNDPAYRTISDVATLIGVPHHVLRFWEAKFPQIAPLKRGGNRRYYRPEDVVVLQRIARLLHVEGYTIKGAQKLLGDGTAGAPAATDAAPPARPSQVVAAPAGPSLPPLPSLPVAPPGPGGAIPRAAVAAVRADLAAALAAARAM